MNDEQLQRSLQSIGKACFVKYLDTFSNSQISNEDLIDYLIAQESYKESGARTRVTQARRIIREGRTADALHMVMSSLRIDDQTRDLARTMIGKWET